MTKAMREEFEHIYSVHLVNHGIPVKRGDWDAHKRIAWQAWKSACEWCAGVADSAAVVVTDVTDNTPIDEHTHARNQTAWAIARVIRGES